MVEEISIRMEKIFLITCGSFENCTESSIQSFLQQCEENGIDSQFCMSWVEQHKSEIPDWQTVSKVSLEWMNQHTSTGSSISFSE
jgi:hypothetical protein